MERKQEVIRQEAQLRSQKRSHASGSTRRARSAVRACAANIFACIDRFGFAKPIPMFAYHAPALVPRVCIQLSRSLAIEHAGLDESVASVNHILGQLRASNEQWRKHSPRATYSSRFIEDAA